MKITVVKKPIEPQRELKLGDVVCDGVFKYLIIRNDNKYGFLGLADCCVYLLSYSSVAELSANNETLVILEAELIITE